jgi:predicted short-subunit dehydrogenase-like oxidoreductase (DUF2520 family)
MLKIVLIGAGNAAYAIGKAFRKEGLEILQIYSRNIEKSKKLANEISSVGIDSLQSISPEANVYLLAIPDHSLQGLAKSLSEVPRLKNSLIVHLSGNSSLSLLTEYFPRAGVFYPLQTMKYGKEISFQKVPFVIDATLEEDKILLTELALRLSSEVFHLSQKQRSTLHLAAVMSNNFVNQLFKEAFLLCDQIDVPTKLLLPLIESTLTQIKNEHPKNLQTGPALRKDMPTLLSHIQLLHKDSELSDIYKKISQRIQPDLKLTKDENSSRNTP